MKLRFSLSTVRAVSYTEGTKLLTMVMEHKQALQEMVNYSSKQKRIPSPLCPALNRVLREKARMRGNNLAVILILSPLPNPLPVREGVNGTAI